MRQSRAVERLVAAVVCIDREKVSAVAESIFGDWESMRFSVWLMSSVGLRRDIFGVVFISRHVISVAVFRVSQLTHAHGIVRFSAP